MSAQKHNRVQIFYNADHPPYMYAAVHIVSGDIDNQWWEKPFVISKRRADGSAVEYGTIMRTLQKIRSQMDKFVRFTSESQTKLDAAGLTPVIQDGNTLPPSAVSNEIMDEQEELIEEVLLNTSVNLRILSEIFPRQLAEYKVGVYDSDGQHVAAVELSGIADLLVHNRYLVVKANYVVDLISDEKFLADQPQMGLKINVEEYLSEVQKVIEGITIKDLVTKLWGEIRKLSASSNIKDIVFVSQNLHTLGGSLVGTDAPITGGPLKTVLDNVLLKHRDKLFSQVSTTGEAEITVAMTFTTPRFYLEPDLDQKQIRVEMRVNGQPQTLVTDYEEIFKEIVTAAGGRTLLTMPFG